MEIRVLTREVQSNRPIAKTLGISRNTVRRSQELLSAFDYFGGCRKMYCATTLKSWC